MKLNKPQITLSLIAAAVLSLTACGGGGSADSGLAGTTAVTTTVMDGLISNALVCIDANNNGICDSGEVQGRTDASGKVTLAIPSSGLAGATLLAMIGTDAVDSDTGPVKVAYTLKAPAGKLAVISPLTNMVQAKIAADKAKGITTSVEAAEAFVKANTGLTVSVFDNFIAVRGQSDGHKKAGEVARLMVVSTQSALTSTPSSSEPRSATTRLKLKARTRSRASRRTCSTSSPTLTRRPRTAR